MTQIRPYYSTMSDWDKSLIVKAFCIPEDENSECTILVVTNAYRMDINNLDVKLIIQWELPILFDSMIQRMSRAGRKDGYFYFVFFSPKWTIVKDKEEITKRSNKTTTSA